VKEMSIKEWLNFGTEVCNSIVIYCKYIELERSKKMIKPAGSRPK
jgi:Sec7-like guanine-nucleotide exchange factor